MTTSPDGKPKPPPKPLRRIPGVYENKDPDAFEAEFAQRMLASAAGLPKICTIKMCRRRGRCFGPFRGKLPCLRRHNGLMGERFHSALRILHWEHVLDELEDDFDDDFD
jgi:hypothetical protein